MMRTTGAALAVLLTAGPALGQSVAPGPSPFGAATMVPHLLACVDWPAATAPVPALTVTAGHAPDMRTAFAAGEIVVLGGRDAAHVERGQRFFVRRLKRGFGGEAPSAAHPAAVRTAGWLTVTAVDARSALARVDFACDAIEAGDYLEPFTPPVLPDVVASGGAPQFDALAVVLFGVDRREQFGRGDFVLLDRGAEAGLAPGTRVAFFRDRHNGTPLVELGDGVVLDATPGVARLVIVTARDAIYAGDYAAPIR